MFGTGDAGLFGVTEDHAEIVAAVAGNQVVLAAVAYGVAGVTDKGMLGMRTQSFT